MSNVKGQMSNVKCQRSNVTSQRSNVNVKSEKLDANLVFFYDICNKKRLFFTSVVLRPNRACGDFSSFFLVKTPYNALETG